MPSSRRAPRRPPGAVLAALGLLVLAGFLLRLRGIDQTLYGDEYFTFEIVTKHGLAGVWTTVYHESITPPLHYALAWGALKLGGDLTQTVRLPSLVLGTLTIPVVFALGREVSGDRAGLVAAGILAFGPFAIWYADEGRAYATLMFLLAVAALALLRAVRGGARGSWALYAAASCAALWTHYTSFFVVGTSLAWALWAHREQARAVLLSGVGIALGYLPWVPGFLNQRTNSTGIEAVDQYATLRPDTPFALNGRVLFGHPFFELDRFPGTAWTAVFALVLVALLVTAVRRTRRGALRSRAGLLAVLAAATTAGVLLYALSGTSLFLPRNLGASLPALAALLGVLAAAATQRLPGRLGPVAAGLLVALFAVDGVRAQDDAYRRPPYREAAEWVNAHGRPGDPVVETSANLGFDPRLPEETVGLYLDPGHPVFPIRRAPEAYARLRSGRTVWFISFSGFVPSGALRRRLAPADITPGLLRRTTLVGGPFGLARERSERHFEGIAPADAVAYRGVVTGHLSGPRGAERIAWTFGRSVRVVPGAARGAVRRTRSANPLVPPFGGWALRGDRIAPVDWVLAFRGRRLVGVSAGGYPGGVTRRFGPRARAAGWTINPEGGPRGVRVFAVVGTRASELR